MQKYLDLTGDKSKILGLSLGSKVLSNDEFVSRTEATSEPQLSFTAGNPSSKYIAVSVDNDAPFASFNILSPILHWMQTDLTVAASTNALTSETPAAVNWIAPNPPPGSSAHRYLFLLYEQPSGFKTEDSGFVEGKSVPLWPRTRWNLEVWERKTKVGQPVAVGYFMSK